MDVLKRLVGVYLVGLALVVAVYFIINAFLVGSIDVLMVWQIVDILMLVGLALGLAFCSYTTGFHCWLPARSARATIIPPGSPGP